MFFLKYFIVCLVMLNLTIPSASKADTRSVAELKEEITTAFQRLQERVLDEQIFVEGILEIKGPSTYGALDRKRIVDRINIVDSYAKELGMEIQGKIALALKFQKMADQAKTSTGAPEINEDKITQKLTPNEAREVWNVFSKQAKAGYILNGVRMRAGFYDGNKEWLSLEKWPMILGETPDRNRVFPSFDLIERLAANDELLWQYIIDANENYLKKEKSINGIDLKIAACAKAMGELTAAVNAFK